MFEALDNRAHTIKVGFGSTHARYQVGTLERVLDVVEKMSRAKPSSRPEKTNLST